MASYENYKALRDYFGVTDYKVAKETGVSPATLSSWKNGVYTPKVDKLLKIAGFFGVTLEQLIGKE